MNVFGSAIFTPTVYAASRIDASAIHPDHNTPLHPRSYFIGRNILSISGLLPHARRLGMDLMIENLRGDFNDPDQLGELLDPLSELGSHLDIGHANLLARYNLTGSILKKYGTRLRQVHLHDNKCGGADLHLALPRRKQRASGAPVVRLRRHHYA